MNKGNNFYAKHTNLLLFFIANPNFYILCGYFRKRNIAFKWCSGAVLRVAPLEMALPKHNLEEVFNSVINPQPNNTK